jgi:WhiB family redox-sensing transcriptional regulator
MMRAAGGGAKLNPPKDGAWRGTGMVVARRHWRSAAECRFGDPELFFPVSSSVLCLEQEAEAKEICARCQVQPECLAFALRTRQVHGVWGGMSEQERYLLWRRDERPTG